MSSQEVESVYVEILKNAFGAMNKFILHNNSENQKKFTAYGVCDLLVQILKKYLSNAFILELPAITYQSAEIVRQLLNSALYLMNLPKNIKRLKALGLKDIVKKYLKEHEKANDILAKFQAHSSIIGW